MSPREHHSRFSAALGLRARKGGAVVVCVTMTEGAPRVVFSSVLDTCADGDRLSFEPYTVATEMVRSPQGGGIAEATAIVREGRKRQEQLATSGLQAIVRQLKAAGCDLVVAALLVNRAGWVTDLFEYSLAWKEHVPVAEALAVRDALRFASSQCDVALVELDEKSLGDVATKTLRLPSMAIDARLKVLGAPIGPPWRKEQKQACLSAWIAASRKADEAA